MQSWLDLQRQLGEIFLSLQQTAIDSIPRIVTGLVILIVLILVAKLVERVLRGMLVRLRFDALLEQAGIDKTLQRLGIRQSLNLLLPRIAYFLLLFLFLRTGADVLGLTAVSDAIGAMFAYLPNIVAAILLLVVGSSVSQFAGQTVSRAAEEAGVEFGKSLGTLVASLILFVVAIMAIAQLRIDTEMVRIVTICSLAALALAFGLSFGLGTRDITRNVMAGFYARKVFRPGDPIEIRGERGVLKAILATQTLIEQESGLVSFANTAFIEEMIRH